MKCSRTRGKKSDWHGHPDDPPRRRANKRRGRGTYANDRPPVRAVIGRDSRQVRMRVMKNTQGGTLRPFVERFTRPEAILYTDEYDSYNQLKRLRLTVCHSDKEWARDADGDGIREVHVNSNGCSTSLPAGPFRRALGTRSRTSPSGRQTRLSSATMLDKVNTRSPQPKPQFAVVDL